jgi:DNA replication and repair protein RecF
MWIKSIRLFQFRNVNEQTISLTPHVNIFVGQNGQGKTNLVESVNLLLKGTSFRFSQNDHLIKLGTDISRIVCKLIQSNLEHEIQLTLDNSNKRHLLNGKPISAGKLGLNFSVILFSPESLDIIKSESQLRRQFIDEMIMNFGNKDFLKTKIDFQKTLKTKNRILKDLKEEKIRREEGLLILKSIEDLFIKLASLYTFHRIYELKLILPLVNQISSEIMNEQVEISIEYVMSGKNALHYSFGDIFQAMKQRAAELQGAELATGYSLIGPQKHDIKFLVNKRDSRIFCSQGQQRALILSFKIAEVVYHKKVYGRFPLLILDDVFSELDLYRREKLMNFLENIKAQSLITTTDEFINNSFKLKEATSVMRVTEGTFITF